MHVSMLLAVVFIAAVARGYTGFGLSAIVITVASYWIPAKELVPVLILLEITASLLFLRNIFSHTDFRAVAIIFAGSAISTPLALMLLSHLPTKITHAVIAALTLAATVTLLLRKNLITVTNNITWLATGLIMGVFGGLGSIGGLAGMVVLMSTTIAATQARATMILLLLITSSYAAVLTAFNGLLTSDSLKQLPVLLIPMAAGLYLGHRLFKHYDRSLRTATLALLAVLSGTMLLQSIYRLFS